MSDEQQGKEDQTPPQATETGKSDEEPEELGEAGGTELRIALAMRGGVSLAVWIGGAMAELDLARRAMLKDRVESSVWDPNASARADAYAALIRAKGYTGLKIDVLAGASAGGLNAVIYGFAQSVGTDLTWLRDVWRNSGDIWGLFHPAWRAAAPFRTEALLQGDTRFYELIYQELTSEKRVSKPTLPPTDYLTVDLAATLQSGPPLPANDGGDDLRPRTAHFRFRRTPATAGGAFNDMPASLVKDAPQGDEADAMQLTAQLAYAARSTSSFPGAFEPATVVSWTSRTSKGRDRARGDVTPENMSAVFSESWTDSESAFYVMDGGVFDNIPIGRALHSIADAPASTPTARVLIYLDPSPPARSAAATPVVERQRKNDDQKSVDGEPTSNEMPERIMRAALVRSTLTAMRYKQTVESSTDDLAELRRLHTSRDDVQIRRELFIDALPGVLSLNADPTDRAERYKAFRCLAAANRLIDLMVTPGTGFLRSLVLPPPITTALSEAGAPQVRAELDKALRSHVEAAEGALEADETALAAAAEFFISWVSAEQKKMTATGMGADSPLVKNLATEKAALYRVRTAALLIRDRREADAVSRALRVGAHVQGPNPYGEIPGVLWPAREVSSASTGTVAAAWPAPGLPDKSRNVTSSDVESRFWERLEEIAHMEIGDRAEDDLIAAGWEFLREILKHEPEPPPPLPTHDGEYPSAAEPLNPVLEKLGYQDLGIVELQWIGVSASLAVGVLMSPPVPRFYSFTGDEPPLDASSLPNVAAEGRAMALDAAITARSDKVRSDVINAQSKLAGNQLANFAGFLSAEWRDHDWRWGSADAGAALICMLEELPDAGKTDEQGDFRENRAHPAENEAVAAQARTRGDTGELHETPGPATQASPAEDAKTAVKLLYRDLDKRKHRPGDLTPRRRFALGARVLLGAQRALWPLTPRENAPARTSMIKSAPTVAAIMVARPLLVLLPLVLRPAILAAAMTTVVLSEYSGVRAGDLSAASAAKDGIFVIEAASPAFRTVIISLAIASAGFGVLSLRNLKQRWEDLRAAKGLDEKSDELSRSVISRIGWAQKAMLLEVVALFVLAAPTESGGVDALNSLTRFSLATAILLLLVANGIRRPFKATSVRKRRSEQREPQWDTRGSVAWAFWSTVMLVWILPAQPPFGASPELREPLATAISVGVLVWAVHHYWAKKWWPGTMGVFSAILVAFGSYCVQPFLTRALDPDSDSKLKDSRLLAIDMLLPLAVVVAVFGVAWMTKKFAAGKRPAAEDSRVPLTRAPATPDPNAPTLREYVFTTGGLAVLLVLALAGSLCLYVSWDWLQVIPMSLVLGSAAAAATTLVAPIKENLDDPQPKPPRPAAQPL